MNLKNLCTSWKLWAGIAVILGFLLFVKRIDFASLTPFAIVLICLLMMLLMMGGHGGHKDK